MFQLPEFAEITPEILFTRLTPIEIFEYYTGLPVVVDKPCRSPFGDDSKPSANYHWVNGRLILTDFRGIFKGDCIEFVKKTKGLNYKQALNRIASDFKLTSATKINPVAVKFFELHKKEKAENQIDVKTQDLTDLDLEYFQSYNIFKDILIKGNVKSVKFMWINGNLKYTYNKNNPAVIYLWKKGFKIYFYKNREFRFLQKHKGIEGEDLLPEKGELLILTKAYKDVLFITQEGIPSISSRSENTYLTKEEIENLKLRFKRIITLFDPDEAGVRATEYYKTLGLEGFNVPTCKDITDFSKLNYLKAKKWLTKFSCTT